MKVAFYISSDGTKPVADYMRALPEKDRRLLANAFFRIETYGIKEAAVNWKHVEDALFEIKVSAHRAFTWW